MRTGVNLSRSTVHYFKHNDMRDLKNIMETIAKDDKKFKRDSTQQRRFIVTEGLFQTTGKVCPLPELVELKNKYCYRILLDETLSFGTIGNTGHGVTEHYGLKTSDIDVIMMSMDCALASIGGGCVGVKETIDHQRLSGAGYCFSASTPPFLFCGALETLKTLEAKGEDLILSMRSNARVLIDGINAIPHLQVISSEDSPVIITTLVNPSDYDNDMELMKEISYKCLHKGVALIVPEYDRVLLPAMKRSNHSLAASLRINASASLTNADMKKVVKELKAAVVQVFGR